MGEGKAALGAAQMVAALAEWKGVATEAEAEGMAVLMVTLVKEHGLQYLFAATVLTGVLQIIAGWVRLGELMRFYCGGGP